MSSAAACHHEPHQAPMPGTRRTKAQNNAYWGMRARVGAAATDAILMELVGNTCSCCQTKQLMHEVLNRMRLALGEPVGRYNRERRRRMVQPQRRPRGTMRVMTGAQAEYIEDLVLKIPGFGPTLFASWCRHYCHDKDYPETSAEAARIITALKSMVKESWKPEHPEERAERTRSEELGTMLYFPPRPEPTPAPAQSPNEEPPF